MNISEFMGKELPPEVLEQLNVVGRIKYLLKPTVVSAISEAENQPVEDELKEVQKDIDGMIDDVAKLEDLVKELEDNADRLLADMNIPPANDMVADACKQLGGDTITKPIFDKALAIIDYIPMITTGQDPFLAALTGDGSISGPRLACSEMGPDIGKKLKLAKRVPYVAEEAIKDAGPEQKKKFNEMLAEMALHLLNVLLWKTLWPILVDQLLINSVRLSIAYPLDSIPGFFERTPTGKSPNILRWKIKSKDWLKTFGRANRALNQLRWFLLCKIVRLIAGQEYVPVVEGIDCSKGPKCAQQGGGPIDSKFDDNIKFHQAADKLNEAGTGEAGNVLDPCITIDDFPGNKPSVPKKFGVSPECIQAAKVIVESVISDAYTPPGERRS
jgi:hypothetical protein